MASIRKNMGLYQQAFASTNLGKVARADVMVISFAKRNCCDAATAARWAADVIKKGVELTEVSLLSTRVGIGNNTR
jgi:hypothetical protein